MKADEFAAKRRMHSRLDFAVRDVGNRKQFDCVAKLFAYRDVLNGYI